MANSLPVEIYNQQDLLERIKGANEFRPQFTSIAYVKKGILSFVVNGVLQEYSANNILFISSRNIYELNDMSADIELYVTYNNRSFNRSLNLNFNRFEIYRLISIEHNNKIAVPEEEFKHIWELLENIYHHFKITTYSQYKADILFHLQGALIYLIVSHLETSTRSRFSLFNNRMERISMSFLELVSNHCLKEKELKFYADKLHISVKYLSICVKETTGYPPTHFLNQLLLDEARIRLLDERDTVSSIAYDLNFADQYSFSKFFKNNMGVSPMKFRKRIAKLHTI